MDEKINKIKYTQHPYAAEINKAAAALEKGIHWLAGFTLTAGLLVGILIAIGGGDVVMVNFFGYCIEFGGSPFMMFCNIGLASALISIALEGIRMVTVSLLRARMYMLNSVYHTELLTKLLLVSDRDSRDKASDSQA